MPALSFESGFNVVLDNELFVSCGECIIKAAVLPSPSRPWRLLVVGYALRVLPNSAA